MWITDIGEKLDQLLRHKCGHATLESLNTSRPGVPEHTPRKEQAFKESQSSKCWGKLLRGWGVEKGILINILTQGCLWRMHSNRKRNKTCINLQLVLFSFYSCWWALCFAIFDYARHDWDWQVGSSALESHWRQVTHVSCLLNETRN